MREYEVIWHGAMLGFVSPWSKTKGELAGLQPGRETPIDTKVEQVARPSVRRRPRAGRPILTNAPSSLDWSLVDDSPADRDNPLAPNAPEHPQADTLLSPGKTSDAD